MTHAAPDLAPRSHAGSPDGGHAGEIRYVRGFREGGRWHHVDPQIQGVLGFSAEEWKADPRRWGKQIHPDDRQRVLQEELDSLHTGRPLRSEYRMRTRTGDMVSLRDEAALVHDASGLPKHWEGVLIDITNERRASYGVDQWQREMSLLHLFSQALQECAQPDDAYPLVAEWASQLFEGRPGALFVVTSSRNLMETVAVWGEPRLGKRVFSVDDCRAVRRRRPHSSGEPGSEACPHLSNLPDGMSLCVPITFRAEPIGILHLQGSLWTRVRKGLEEEGSDTETTLPVAAADCIGLALVNAEIRQVVRLESIRDPLTQLFNRPYMEESLERELLRATRSGEPVGLIMLQIDQLRGALTSGGPHTEVVRRLGEMLRTRVRAEDIACRYGEEEFALLMPGAPIHVILPRAEQVREEARHLMGGGTDGQPAAVVTISLGVAMFPKHAQTSDELIVAARRALAQAQKEGRNRVVVAGSRA